MRIPPRLVALFLAVVSTELAGQNPFPSGSPITQAPDHSLLAPTAYPDRIQYADRSWQKIELFRAKRDTPAPLVIALGDLDKLGWLRFRLNESGVSLAVIPDRAAASPRFPHAIGNYMAAIGYLFRDADQLGIDGQQLVLIGFGRGASIATLFGSDPQLLARAGIPFDNLRGVIAIGGVDFDIEGRMSRSAYLRSLYRRDVSRDETELRQLSPRSHVASPNAPEFLLAAVAGDEDAIAESKIMAAAFQDAGTAAAFAEFPEQREGRRRTYLWVEEDGAGYQVMAFVRSRFDHAPGSHNARPF